MTSQKAHRVAPVAIRQELSLFDPVDVSSPPFIRFVIRFSELLDADIPREDYPLLATIAGCHEYLGRRD